MSNPGSSAGARPEGGDDSRGPGGRGGDPPAPDAASVGGGPGVGAAAAAIVVTQVSGYQGQLIDAIREGKVPKPDLMQYNAWISWRKAEGKRPITRKDGVGTKPSQEADMWREVMAALYGDDWRVQLDALEVGEEADEEGDERAAEVPAVAPVVKEEVEEAPASAPEAAGTPKAKAAPRSEARPAAKSEAAADAPKTPRGAIRSTPAAAVSPSGRLSTHSSLPNSPREMRKKLFGADAGELTLDQFEEKLIRVSEGLDKFSQPHHPG